MKHSIKAEIRTPDMDLRAVRNGTMSGKTLLPGIIYGKGTENVMISLDYSDFLHVFAGAKHSAIVTLDVNGSKFKTIIEDVQEHPVSGRYIHADFHTVKGDEKLTTSIPTVLTGSAPAGRDGALIDHVTEEIEIRCLPGDLVDNIQVDISKLVSVWDVIRISDLGLDPKKYEIMMDADLPVVVAEAAHDHEADLAKEAEEQAQAAEAAAAETPAPEAK